MAMLLVYLGIALGVSFLCSVLEAVLLSITPSFVASAALEGSHFGRRLQAFKTDIDRPLASILTLNTFAHTIGAAGVGAQAQLIWGETALTVVSAVVTVLILVLSEIIPKTLGAVHWRKLAEPTVSTLQVLVVILSPFVWVSQIITRILKQNASTSSVLSRADIGNLAAVGYRDGVLRQSEHSIIRNLMNFSKVRVTDIMVPFERMVMLDAASLVGQLKPDLPAWHCSRIPIHRGNPHQIIGYVFKDEILAAALDGRRSDSIGQFRRDIVALDMDCSLPELYVRLIERSEHIAVVQNEHQIVGLVTMEDLIETLLGLEIIDESDVGRDPAEQQRWLEDRQRRQQIGSSTTPAVVDCR